MALYADVASLTVNQFDCCNLLWRSIIRYGEHETTHSREVTTGMVGFLFLAASVGGLFFIMARCARAPR